MFTSKAQITNGGERCGYFIYGIFKTTNHAVLLPTSALLGATLALLASLFSYLPLQAIMSVIGVPVILWVLLSSRGKNRE